MEQEISAYVTLADRERVSGWIIQFGNWCHLWLFFPVTTALGVPLTGALAKLKSELEELQHELHQFKGDPIPLKPRRLPLFKRVLIHQKKHISETQVQALAKTFDIEFREAIEELSAPVNRYMTQGWFDQVSPRSVPTLADFLSLENAYAVLPEKITGIVGQFDEKFHILQAPTSFIPRLRIARLEAWLRHGSVCIAYMDIDDFKSFNTQYGEARVDRDFLPRLMQVIEQQTHSHGWAFRFGGDEYALLLSNMPQEWAIDFLRRLQTLLYDIQIPGIDKKVTVSVGLCCLDNDSFLADNDAYELAIRAKKFAKEHTGKDCIAGFAGNKFQDSDLRIHAKRDAGHSEELKN